MTVVWWLTIGASWAFYIDSDGDGFPVSVDCDDRNGEIYPGAPEVVANGIDEDCDGRETCWRDVDGDRFGVPETVLSTDLTCSAAGTAANPDDCDDTRPTVYPGAPEVPLDNVDQSCDGAELCATDADLDGYGVPSYVNTTDLDCVGIGYADTTDDCNDNDPDVNPGEPEIPGDGVDSNCTNLEICYLDGDGDGYGSTATGTSSDVTCTSAGFAPNADDCDDSASSTYPGAVEVPNDGTDQDCNGYDFATCYRDDDADGYGRGQATYQAYGCTPGSGFAYEKDDCDDADPDIHPGAEEIALDGVDQDCDGFELCYLDADLDGVGTETTTLADLDCLDPGASDRSDDCDDTDTDISPLAIELTCDGIDQDCDPATEDDPDGDGDGYTFCTDDCDDTDNGVNPGVSEVLCNIVDDDCDPSTLDGVDGDGDGVSICAGDCNDGNPAISPLEDEIECTGIDEDCDPLTRDSTDADGDGIATCDGDCNDLDPNVNPGVPEVLCNGIDDDCNRATPDGCIDSADTGPTGDTGTPQPTGGTGTPGTIDTSPGTDTGPTTTPPTTTDTGPIGTVPPTGTTTLPDGKAVEAAAPEYGFGCRGVPGPSSLGLAFLAVLGLRARRRRAPRH